MNRHEQSMIVRAPFSPSPRVGEGWGEGVEMLFIPPQYGEN